MKLMCTLFLVLSFVAIALSDDEAAPVTGPARLLVEKKLFNTYLVENRDITINYHVYNVGKSAAVDITLNDPSFHSNYFETVSGVTSFVIPRLAPGANSSHSVVYKTKLGVSGKFNFVPAIVTYRSGEDAKTLQTGISSEPGEGFIIPEREFDRRFSPHVMDWLMFALMTTPVVLFPYLLWSNSKNKYEAISASKKISKSQ